MPKSLVLLFIGLLLAPSTSRATATSSSGVLPEALRTAAPGSSWSAGLVTLTLGSRFFWGASATRNFGSPLSAGLRAGAAAIENTGNQSLLSAFGRWRTNAVFFETAVTSVSGLRSGSQLLGLAVGTQIALTHHWKGEMALGYEGIDRLLFRSPFSSWSTARIQVGLTRDLDL